MKFHDTISLQMFLVECGRFDLLSKVSEDFTPDDDLIEVLVKSRNKLIPKKPDFAKSQEMKSKWNTIKGKLMKGIQTFHSSTAGKRFHRALNRFLATRMGRIKRDDVDTKGHRNHNDPEEEGGLRNKDRKEESYNEKVEFLKAVSSYITHLHIENEYFHPLSEEVSFTEFFNVAIPLLRHIELKVLNEEALDSIEMDFIETVTLN